MDKERLDKTLKIIMIILLLALLIVMRVYKLDSCDLIKEETEGLTQGQIVSLYYADCLSEYKINLNSSTLESFSNITILKK